MSQKKRKFERYKSRIDSELWHLAEVTPEQAKINQLIYLKQEILDKIHCPDDRSNLLYFLEERMAKEVASRLEGK